MKAMSRFFLLVAGILAAIGAVLMIIGSIMAKSSGVQLYQQKVDGKYLYKLDLADKDIAKISIDATNTDITVYTGEEEEYIEFINFNENYYSITTTNKVVKFEERVSLNSLISFWDGNFTFKGMRSFLNLGSSADGPKEVNIHLKDTSEINVFSFTITDGNIKVSDADSNTDYIITMDSGNVTMNNVKTASKVMINGNNCAIEFKSCAFKYFASDVASVDLTAEISGLHSFEFTGKNGVLNASVSLDSDKSDVRIASELPFTYNETEYNGEYASNDKTVTVTDEFALVHITGAQLKVTSNVTLPQPEAPKED